MVFMKRQSLVPKKRRGPPPTGQGIQIQVRIQPDKLAELDRWIAAQTDQPSRPEAIRRMVERTLARSARPKAANKQKAQKASELASNAADRLVDKSMPPEEQERRKRALIKGPKEFRDIREDLPKPK
jgi:metal-responsive CopG/Arc/MetJ family transcriptional regulator